MSYPSLDFGLWIFFGGEWGGIVGKLFACFFFAWFLSVPGSFRANSHWALPPVWKPNSKLVALTAGSDPGPDGGNRCNKRDNDQAAASTSLLQG